MKFRPFIVACIACTASIGADLSDLMIQTNPDDVMLRKPKTPIKLDQKAEAEVKADAEAKAKAEAEAKAKAEAEARAKAEAAAKAKAEAAAKAKAEAEAKAKAEAAAKAKAEAEAKAAAEKAKAEAAAKAKAEAEAKAKAEEEIKALREQVEREKAAREAAEKRVEYLLNPDPDERPKPKKLEAPAEAPGAAADKKQEGKPAKKHKKAGGATVRTGRDAIITSERTDYDRKEGVILFDRNVYVDDEQYQMHADRLFVFLDGTNDLKRIVAIGNVSITNDERTASCSRAVFTKAASKIVMYGDEASDARLQDPTQNGGMVAGKKITFWLDAEQVSVEGSTVNLPGGALKGKDPKKLLEQAR